MTILALTNVVNQLLDSKQDSTVTIQSEDTKDLSGLTAYAIEALSTCPVLVHTPFLTSDVGIDPPFAGFYRVAKKDENVVSLNVKQGERLFLNVAAANMNVSFRNATQRPLCFLHAQFRRMHSLTQQPWIPLVLLVSATFGVMVVSRSLGMSSPRR